MTHDQFPADMTLKNVILIISVRKDENKFYIIHNFRRSIVNYNKYGNNVMRKEIQTQNQEFLRAGEFSWN